MNYTNEQIRQAIELLPEEIQDMLFSPENERAVQKIGIENGLLINQLKTLNGIVNFSIMGLVPEDDVAGMIVKELSIPESQAKEIAEKVSTEMIKPANELKKKLLAEQKIKEEKAQAEALEEQRREAEEAEEAEKENAEETEEVESGDEETTLEGVPPAPLVPNVPRAPRAPDIAPDNLPTGETEPLLPPLAPKPANLEVEPPSEHPFEEKMKRVFTAGQQSMGELTLEPASQNFPQENLGGQAAPPVPTPDTARLSHDPYREPVE